LVKKANFILMMWLSLLFPALACTFEVSSEEVEQFIQEKLPNTSMGILLADLKTGRAFYERRSQETFIPASNAKLLTSAAALYVLGLSYRYETTFQANPQALKADQLQGDLYLAFTGDPSLQTADLQALVRKLKIMGIRRITGNLVLDATRFQEPVWGPGWGWEATEGSSATRIMGVILNKNVVRVQVADSEILKDKAIMTLSPNETAPVRIQQNIASMPKSEKCACELKIVLDEENDIKASGCWLRGNSHRFKRSLQNPLALAKRIVTVALQNEGIQLEGRAQAGVVPFDVKPIAVHQSEPLSELLKPILQDSINVYADSLVKTMGFVEKGEGSFKAGINVVMQVLKNKWGFDRRQFRLYEGSGFSRYNLVSPMQVGKLLHAMYHDKTYGKIFLDAMAVSGESGTLDKRMNTLELKGKVRAKTGALLGNVALSGYLTTQNNETIIFVLMMNSSLYSRTRLRQFADEWVAWLSRH